MKYLIIGILVLASSMFYFMYQSNKASAERLRQAEIAHQQKLEQGKLEEKAREQKKIQKVEIDGQIKILQSKYSMDYLDARKIIESKKMSGKSKIYYAEMAEKWVDALNVAGATSRASLSNPVKDLQEIRRELREKKTETYCESRMKDELLKSYDFAIDGFLNFMKQNEIISNAFIKLSSDHQQNANSLIDYC